MAQWFRSDPITAILYIMAIPASVILVLQTILLLFGIGGDHDTDLDTSTVDVDINGDGMPDITVDGHDVHPDAHLADSGLRLITVRGIVAFFAVGGWSGLAALELGASRAVAIIAAFLMGFAALIMVAVFFKWAMTLQSNGTLNKNNAVGCTGEVYMNIPANAAGSGKVNVIVQERMAELEAVTYADRDLKFGEKVIVTEVIGGGVLVVKPLVER
ncbi:MAG: hypothetical protein IJP17_00570 [Clostridia bacterium]|nr:hypothetical protein [Clostridia bacterium]